MTAAVQQLLPNSTVLAIDRAGSIDGAIEYALRPNETPNALLGTAEIQHYSNALKVGTT